MAALVIFSAEPSANPGRFLYVVDAGGGITKLDTVLEKKIFSYDLASRTGKLKIPPTAGPGAPDGCLASQAVYDPAAGRFYTVVAEQYHMKADGTKDFRVLAFTVPGIQLAGQWSAGKNVNDEEEPYINSVANGDVKVISPNDRVRQTTLDVSNLEPLKKQLQNRILETSGDSILINLLGSNDGGFSIAVAHPRAKTLAQFATLPGTDSSSVHLTPDGAFVVVARSDGSVALYSAKTAQMSKEIPGVKSEINHFLAISPSGKAIFNAETFRFVNLGLTFPNVRVVDSRSSESCGLPFFFADK